MTDSHGPRVPRASVMVVHDSVTELRRRRKRRNLVRTIVGVLVLVVLVWGGNSMLVGRPVAAALASDSFAVRVGMSARFLYRLDLSTLVLELRRGDDSIPELPLYALVVVAGRMNAAERHFGRVVLAGAAGAAYVVSGADFDRLGGQFHGRGNPVEWARVVPPLLRGTRGADAFGPLAGPLPPLLGLTAVDAASAEVHWKAGTP